MWRLRLRLPVSTPASSALSAPDRLSAPPYVADELRDAHIAEDTYRADAVLAWHRADAAPDEAGRATALREAGEYGALAYREALTEVAEARRRWHAATEQDRQRALIADTELRRRHPDAKMPLLHPPEEPVADAAAWEASGAVAANQQLTPGAAAEPPTDTAADAAASRHDREPDASTAGAGLSTAQAGQDPGGRQAGFRHDVKAALEAARMAEKIIAIRELQADRDAGFGSDDVMRRRKAAAQQEASARASAVRQDPHRAATPDRPSMSQNWRPGYDQDYGHTRGC